MTGCSNKFRVWVRHDLKHAEKAIRHGWLEGQCDWFQLSPNGQEIMWGWDECEEPLIIDRDVDLEFSTGLLDMEGIEIFQGDICTINYGIPPSLFQFKVEAIPGGLGFDGHGGTPSSGPMCDLCDLTHDMEVRGNIHETPELLEAK